VATGVYGQKAQPAFTSISLQPTVAYVKYHGENKACGATPFQEWQKL